LGDHWRLELSPAMRGPAGMSLELRRSPRS
jgi:hypothetical protein